LQKHDGFGRHDASGKSQIEKKKILYDITYIWNLKITQTSEYNFKKKQTHRCRKQTIGIQWREGEGKGHDRGRKVRGSNY